MDILVHKLSDGCSQLWPAEISDLGEKGARGRAQRLEYWWNGIYKCLDHKNMVDCSF